ncbi:MAG: hypothetical protein PHF79_02075, partial [Candidatus Pacebacteria bacterium]|nr:hypothetical protein [Candidatus Paceibacterota bacterium]
TSTNHGVVNGAAILNGDSINSGTINGNTTLNGTSFNASTVNGDLTFGTFTSAYGQVTLSGSTNFLGTSHVSGSILDHVGNPITSWLFKDTSVNAGYTIGNSFFNASSTNTGTVVGNAYFSDSSSNAGTVTGTADIYYSSATPLGGTTGGAVTYHSYPNSDSFSNISGDNDWNNLSNWFTDTTLAIPLGRTPTTGENIVLFASTTLPSDITNDVFFAVSSSTLNGAGHTLTGNLSGNGAYTAVLGSQPAYGFSIQNITVTGSSTAIGGDGSKGGVINLLNAVTGPVQVNGGDPVGDGGDGGFINATSARAIVSNTPMVADGGAAQVCGSGGNGGNINLIDTTGYVTSVNPGSGAGSCAVPAVPGAVYSYSTPPSPPSNSSVETNTPSGGGSTGEYVPGVTHPVTFTSPFSYGSNLLNVNLPNALNLRPLPVFGGTSTNSFSFKEPLSKFLFEPLSNSIQAFLNKASKLKTFLADLGISYSQDLAAAHLSPVAIPTQDSAKIPPGLFSVSLNGKKISSTLTSSAAHSLIQKIFISAKTNAPIDISLIPIGTGKVTASFSGKTFIFAQDPTSKSTPPLYLLSLSTPPTPGTYYLTSPSTPITLEITILKPLATSTSSTTPSSAKPPNLWQKLWNLVGGWFGRK